MYGDLMYNVRKENQREISWENRRSEWMYMMFFGLRMMLEGAGMRNCRWRQSLQLCTLRGNSSRLKGVDGIRGVWLKSTWEDNGRSHYCSLEKEEIWLLVEWLGNEFPHEERGSKPEQKWLQDHMCVCLCMFLFIFFSFFLGGWHHHPEGIGCSGFFCYKSENKPFNNTELDVSLLRATWVMDV